MSRTQSWMTYPRSKRAGYRVVNHPEAGIFDTMTEATIWALKNLSDWDWWIEPVDGTASERRPLLPEKTAIKLCFGQESPQTIRQNADGTRICIE